MRTRDRDQEWIEELGRRRLEALIAELTPPGTPERGDGPPRETGARPVEPEDGPDDLPAAGRHARRGLSPAGRVGGWMTDRLPGPLRGRGASPTPVGPGLRRGLQQGHVGVLALVLAVAVLLGGWSWARTSGAGPGATKAPAVSAPGAASASSGLLTSPSDAEGAAEGAAAQPGAPSGAAVPASTEVVVHVAGRVRRPGIVVLPTGSRVVDAVRRAGGFVPGVGPRSAALNLARVLVDGEQIVVAAAGVVGAVPSPTGAGAVVPGAAVLGSGALVSLNTADQAALESLPGVGPVTATAILQWRTEHGPFTAVEQLLEVSGIGEATLSEIEPHVTL